VYLCDFEVERGDLSLSSMPQQWDDWLVLDRVIDAPV
jgi:hypothetical protein